MRTRIRFRCRSLLLLFALLLPGALPAQWSGTDAEFVAMVGSNNWAFFQNNQGGPFMLFRGSGHYDDTYSYDTLATCAGDGFGIASLCAGAYRGWMDNETAYGRVLAILRSYENDLSRDTTNHWFNHFYVYTNGAPAAEYFIIDHTWLLCGAIVAAEYFKGTEVEEIANRLYSDTIWTNYSPYWSGYFEYIIINVVGAGAPSNTWTPAEAKAGWEFATTQTNLHGPLFWYQWPQAYVDFRRRRDGNGAHHFDLAMEAFLRQRQKCANMHGADPTNYPDFGTNGWGLTSAGASLGYLEMRPWGDWCTWNTNYGTPGCGYGLNYIGTDEEACDSGTLVPISLPACMAHTPYEAREAMKHLYNTYEPTINVYGMYSFMNSFNTGKACSSNEHYSVYNATMDYGANVLAVENFRSGMPWKYFMSHPWIAQGMNNCGITTETWIAYHDDWNDGADTNAWGGNTTFTNVDGTDPTAAYVDIDWYTNWVNGKARRLATTGTGSGDVVRIELNETDQSKEDLLSFWLRGLSGGEQFDVGLRDAEGHEVRFDITNVVAGGSVPTNWCRVRVALRDYAVSGDPNDDVRIVFLGDFNVRFRAAGAIEIDDLAFVGDDLAPQPPATFGAACVNGRVRMRWGYPPDDDVVGYHLHRRPDGGSGFTCITTALLAAAHTSIDVSVESQWGEDFYYTVQAVDRAGHAGDFASGACEQRVWIGRRRDLDWGDGLNANTFGGSHGTWGGSWGDVRFMEQTGWDGITQWVRRVEGDTGNGVWIGLGGSNVADYEALCFWMKQNWGANTFDIGLKSTNYVEIKVPITRYTAVTSSWNYVIIPLIDFRGVDFEHMDNISFTFNTPGSFYADEMRFVRLERESDVLLPLEGEDVGGHVGGDTNDWKAYASQGRVLGYAWATNAGDDAWWSLCPSNDFNEAYLDVRYACAAGVGRNLNVVIDSDVRGTLSVATTAGWGDSPEDFREDTVRLGRITNDCFLLKLQATNAGSAVNLDRVILRTGSRYFREAEHCDAQGGSAGKDYKSGASGGEVLGNSWGGGNGEYADYSNIVFSAPVPDAVLRVRYGQSWGDGRLVRVDLDGTNMGRLSFARTEGWLDTWSHGAIAELPLGTVGAGTHTVRFEAVGDDEDVNVDWLRFAEGPEPVKAYDTDKDGIPDMHELLYGTSTNLVDTDGDGLTDREELSLLCRYLTSPTDADSDDDEMTDRQEWVAGTDPTDTNSVFVFFQASPATGGGIRLTWPGAGAGTYEVQYANGGHSNNAGFAVVSDPENITVSNTAAAYTDDGTGTTPSPGDPSLLQRAYRVRAFEP